MPTSNNSLPAWYHRLAPHFKSGGVVLPWTFDEDISDLDEDETSNYDGPDAASFHQLKEMREQRKQELQKRKDFVQKQKDRNRQDEIDKVREVQMAYETLESSMPAEHSMPVLGPLDTTFELYSIDYFNHLYDPTPSGSRKKYLRFQHAEEQPQGPGNNLLLEGILWLNPDAETKLAPFYPPTQSSLQHYRLDTADGKFALILQFVDNNYLTLRVSRDLVFMNKPQEATGPQTFVFGGIRNDWGKQLQAFAKMSAQGREDIFLSNMST
ncbi:hypothetical protein FVEN_g2978 [Fusarium venenatum]|uniref:Uncharacterized protein n=1 Tax=Fusarium venenatum TaxID=56646 RepID=A0A2L2T9I3_9HYPO|nr:uncharacterized protein FVRRES_06367 [Fusarium venenatum]KAG8359468.1 hypothetical protein FVEN_g2978 [Fusarium venenatum]KAH6993367.1 hypothetical protein EDB82DRAFT_171398 [Fusarium venenatum]CEI61931.1 unnamed protein product [Fusarium venenatum]